MKQIQSVYQKHFPTDVEQSSIQTSKIKEMLLENNILSQRFAQNEEGLNWIKAETLPHRMEVSFTRPMKNIEYEKSGDNVGHWSAYYNVQLPVIIIESLNDEPENKVTLKAVQVTQLNGVIEKVTELVGENTELSTNQRIELKGLKLNTPQKIQNKKKCLHHIAICAFQHCKVKPSQEPNLVGVSICGGFSLKSRKKSHQEKGLDTSYFKPIELTQTLQQRKCKQQPVNITEDIDGLQLYFTSPNIRHKIVHPLFLSIRFSQAVKLYLCKNTFPQDSSMENLVRKICQEFSTCTTGSKKQRQQTIAIVISDNNNINNLNEEECRKQKKCMQKIFKALECAKESKCLYILKSENNEMEETTKYYPYETQDVKNELIRVYKAICQSHSGVNDSEWYYQDNYYNENLSNNSQTEEKQYSNKKKNLSTIIDVNSYRLQNDKKNQHKQYQKIHVIYQEDTQSPTHSQENQKNLMNFNDDLQEEALSQLNSSGIKESQRTILEQFDINGSNEKPKCKTNDDETKEVFSKQFIKQEEQFSVQHSTSAIQSVNITQSEKDIINSLIILKYQPKNIHYCVPRQQHAQPYKTIPPQFDQHKRIDQIKNIMIRDQIQQNDCYPASNCNPYFIYNPNSAYQQHQQQFPSNAFSLPQGFPVQMFQQQIRTNQQHQTIMQIPQNQMYYPIQSQIMPHQQFQPMGKNNQQHDLMKQEFSYPYNLHSHQQNHSFTMNMDPSVYGNR